METVYEELQSKLDSAYEEIRRNRLPGWEAVFFSPEVHPWMLEQENKLFTALNDEAEVRFTRALGQVRHGWFRINQKIAEAYRKANPNPEEWELRYIKYMTVSYIRCESSGGEFYLTPRRRKPKPGVKAISIEEVEKILETPLIAHAINLFGGMPANEAEFTPPAKGEKHIHFFAGAERPFRTVFSEEDFGGRKSFRRRPFPDDPEGF